MEGENNKKKRRRIIKLHSSIFLALIGHAIDISLWGRGGKGIGYVTIRPCLSGRQCYVPRHCFLPSFIVSAEVCTVCHVQKFPQYLPLPLCVFLCRCVPTGKERVDALVSRHASCHSVELDGLKTPVIKCDCALCQLQPRWMETSVVHLRGILSLQVQHSFHSTHVRLNESGLMIASRYCILYANFPHVRCPSTSRKPKLKKKKGVQCRMTTITTNQTPKHLSLSGGENERGLTWLADIGAGEKEAR